MNDQSPRTKYILMSRCPKCFGISQIEYIAGIENHECPQGHTWSKSPESTTAAIMGIVGEQDLRTRNAPRV